MIAVVGALLCLCMLLVIVGCRWRRKRLRVKAREKAEEKAARASINDILMNELLADGGDDEGDMVSQGGSFGVPVPRVAWAGVRATESSTTAPPRRCASRARGSCTRCARCPPPPRRPLGARDGGGGGAPTAPPCQPPPRWDRRRQRTKSVATPPSRRARSDPHTARGRAASQPASWPGALASITRRCRRPRVPPRPRVCARRPLLSSVYLTNGWVAKLSATGGVEAAAAKEPAEPLRRARALHRARDCARRRPEGQRRPKGEGDARSARRAVAATRSPRPEKERTTIAALRATEAAPALAPAAEERSFDRGARGRGASHASSHESYSKG